jgi:hypothetical protein
VRRMLLNGEDYDDWRLSGELEWAADRLRERMAELGYQSPDSDTEPQVWWANNGANLPEILDHGILWSCPKSDGVIPIDRAALGLLRRGDLVLHYDEQRVRAVSTVTDQWRVADLAPGYLAPEGAVDARGWAVRVTPRRVDLDIPWEVVAQLVTWGRSGPLNKNGVPKNAFLFPVRPREAAALLAHAGLEVATLAAEELGRSESGGTADDDLADRPEDSD